MSDKHVSSVKNDFKILSLETNMYIYLSFAMLNTAYGFKKHVMDYCL